MQAQASYERCHLLDQFYIQRICLYIYLIDRGYFYLTIVWIGVDLRILECQYQGKPVRITLWDTGGQSI